MRVAATCEPGKGPPEVTASWGRGLVPGCHRSYYRAQRYPTDLCPRWTGAGVTGSAPDRLPTVAVVLAGGTGSRVGLDRPKQLLKVAGSTVIEHTVAALSDCAEIDEIVIMMAADYVAEAEELLLGQPHFRKVTRVLAGGADRNQST